MIQINTKIQPVLVSQSHIAPVQKNFTKIHEKLFFEYPANRQTDKSPIRHSLFGGDNQLAIIVLITDIGRLR